MKKQIDKLFLATVISATISPVWGKSNAALPLDEIRDFVDVYNTIRHEYVEEKDGKTLMDYAIEGMLSGLDPHSAYLKKSALSDFQDNTNGSYKGYGIQLEVIDGKLIIVSPIPGSPADDAGLQPNDHIMKIDDTVIENMSMPEISRLLKDTDKVTFTIKRKGEDTQQVELAKTTVNLPSVSEKVLEKDYGYIRVSQFQADTGNQFDEALVKLLDKNIKGLVLDLRNNPGGLIVAATSIADAFLPAGLIVSTKNQNTGSEDKIHANKMTLAEDLPLVVLINEGSASASELLAGALQSHKRAVVVGRPSFGKGSVQNIIPLANGNAVKLTTARYYTPSGESIQAKGITPDIILSQLMVENKDISLLSYGEADIPNHLGNDNAQQNSKPSQNPNKNSSNNSSKNNQTGDAYDQLAKNDLQLFEALNVLKVLNLKN